MNLDTMSDQMDTQDGSSISNQPSPFLDLAFKAIPMHDTQYGFSTPNQMSSLLDLASDATVIYCNSSELDETMLQKVVRHSFPPDIRCVEGLAIVWTCWKSYEEGVKLEKEHAVKEMYQIGLLATAHLTKVSPVSIESTTSRLGPGESNNLHTIQPEHGEIRVSMVIEGRIIVGTTCWECRGINRYWCKHAFAAIIHRIKYPEKVTMHAPMTESLSSLSRDQLQKLLQYAADEDPAGVLGNVFKHYNGIRDINSKMNKYDWAPDPTYGGHHAGDKSRWNTTLDRLNDRISSISRLPSGSLLIASKRTRRKFSENISFETIEELIGKKRVLSNTSEVSVKMDTQDGCSTTNQLPTLMDLAAHATGKYCSSSELDGYKDPLEVSQLLKVAYHSFPTELGIMPAFSDITDRPDSWNKAVKLQEENDVKEMYQIAHLAKFTQGSGWQIRSGEIKVSLLVEKQKIIRTSCSECSGIWCEHVFAAIIHRIKHPEKVPIHAPTTESLSSLSRDQLQKLLQYAVNEDPAGVLGKIFKHLNEIRDPNSQMNLIDGAPDPTYGGLQGGEKSLWDLSLDLLRARISKDLDSILHHRPV